jgi:AraC family transcriptional regulator
LESLQDSYRMSPAVFVPELPHCGISLFRWRRTEGGASHIIRHPLSTYTLSLTLQPMLARAWFGSTLVWSGPIGGNAIRLTPPGVEPRWQSEGAFDFLLFTIPRRTIESIAGPDIARIRDPLNPFRPLYLRDDVASQIGRHMLTASEHHPRYARPFADGLGSALVAHVLDAYTSAPATRAPLRMSTAALRRVTQYVADHLSEDIRVTDLAAAAGLSESHFAHAFRLATGVPPHRFVVHARIDRARELLRASDRPIATVALDCGFKRASHFARVFQATTGLTPREYRFSG